MSSGIRLDPLRYCPKNLIVRYGKDDRSMRNRLNAGSEARRGGTSQNHFERSSPQRDDLLVEIARVAIDSPGVGRAHAAPHEALVPPIESVKLSTSNLAVWTG
jgi:hypothetical protein